jgi:hypothetical protein
MRALAALVMALCLGGAAQALEPLTTENLPARYGEAAAKLALATQLLAPADPCRRFCAFAASGDIALIAELAETPLGSGEIRAFSLTFPGDGEIDDFGAALSALYLTLAPDLSDTALRDAVDETIRAQDASESVDLVVGIWALSGNAAEGGTFVLFGQKPGARR